MREDPVALLERELLDAARRRVVLPPPPEPPGRRRGSLGAFAAVVLSGVAVAVGLGAVVSLRGHRTTSPPRVRPSAASIPGRRQLLDILGVLRRSQTRADVRPGWIPPSWGTVDPSLVRRATVTPWGEPVLLVPLRPSGGGRRATESLVMQVGSGGGCCATASDIATYGDMVTEGAGRSFAGGSTKTRVTALVPDGVATVEFVLPRQPSPQDPGAPIYPSALTVTAPVHNNVAAVEVARECCAGTAAVLWKAADGHVIKQIGRVATASRLVATPQPAPETPLSRAAERDPSTPNQVWVTPVAGGPRTVFSVHFRLLLTDADYRYRVTGETCPQYTFPGGGGGGTGDIRGRIWSDSLNAVRGQSLCPGTYHVTVAVMDLGRYGQLKHLPGPFGSAAFTVIR